MGYSTEDAINRDADRRKMVNSTWSRREKLSNIPKMSPAGVDFLKSAFAPPDFSNVFRQGIPDEYNGAVVPIQHKYNQTLQFEEGKTTYIVIPPVPGVAWLLSVPIGNAIVGTELFTTLYFNDFGPFFTGDVMTTTQNMVKFRFAGLAAELVPTSNYMQYGGLISCTKANIDLVYERDGALVMQHHINGFESLNFSAVNQYNAPFIDGCYSVACCNESDFEFSPVLDNVENIAPRPQEGQFCGIEGRVTGMGNMESIIFKIDTPSGARNSGLFKVWQSVEYQVQTNGVLASLATISAQYDPVAMRVYRELISIMPVAVTFYNNAGFWEWLGNAIKSVTSALSVVPGPIGMGAMAANTLANLAY